MSKWEKQNEEIKLKRKIGFQSTYISSTIFGKPWQ